MATRTRWNDRDLDDKFAEIDTKLAELDSRQSRLRRSVRNRPTRWQVNKWIDERSGGATRGQLAIATIGALGIVVAALIAAYVQIKTATPIPVK